MKGLHTFCIPRLKFIFFSVKKILHVRGLHYMIGLLTFYAASLSSAFFPCESDITRQSSILHGGALQYVLELYILMVELYYTVERYNMCQSSLLREGALYIIRSIHNTRQGLLLRDRTLYQLRVKRLHLFPPPPSPPLKAQFSSLLLLLIFLQS